MEGRGEGGRERGEGEEGRERGGEGGRGEEGKERERERKTFQQSRSMPLATQNTPQPLRQHQQEGNFNL